jgi:hypothetical protein
MVSTVFQSSSPGYGQAVDSFSRFGNAFAISTSLCLKTAVGIAYLQVLWRRLSKSHTSVRTINSSFDILGNVFSLFNFELWKKIQIGVLLALILW